MGVVRSWNIVGSDGKPYTVNERERPGLRHNPVAGARQTIDSGLVEFVLADGRDLVNDKPGYWEVLATGALLKKPDDLG